MPRYIDADALLKNWCESICKPKPNCSDDCFIYSEITNAPTADVRENVHGEWIDDYDPVNFGEFRYKCSKCGARTVEWADNFCYRCGADMRGVEDD